MMFLLPVLGFFKKYWYIVALVFLLIGMIWGIHLYGNARYQAGINDTKQVVREQIAKQDVKNREKERLAQESVTRMKDYYEKELAKRNDKEIVYRDRAIAIIEKTPFLDEYQCTIPEAVLNERNSIRALGPK